MLIKILQSTQRSGVIIGPVSRIKLLSDDLINQIAAGEIVERPASALKELVENSLDANAKTIAVFLQNGGKSKMVIQDDGEGIDRADLHMAVQRHATSKLHDDNLFDIRSYGFRGEALPSIASVSCFSLESKGFGININFSEESAIFPSNISDGTRVSVSNLFGRTPARLKFLKSDIVELTACLNVIENIALIRPNVNFSLRTDEKQLMSFNNGSIEERISEIFGSALFKKAIPFEEKGDHISVSGYLFHPLDNRYSQHFQRIFINGRIVKDKTVSLALKNAYKELIPSGRFAIAVIFIEIDPFHLDANISPTKSEVRFRDSTSVQKFLTEAFRKNMHKFDRISSEFEIIRVVEKQVSENDNTPPEKPKIYQGYRPKFNIASFPAIADNLAVNSRKSADFDPPARTEGALALAIETEDVHVNAVEPLLPQNTSHKSVYGRPLAQVFNSYIITEVEDGILIIDQHAVHEKITQTRIINNLTKENKQYLLKPEIIELNNSEQEVAKNILASLNECGFSAEIIQTSIMITAIPSILKIEEALQFIHDILASDEFSQEIETLDMIRKKIADKACHNSIRFGRKLSMEEMKEILKQMEETPSIHQCNHHRPSFFKISKSQLEKMMQRG